MLYDSPSRGYPLFYNCVERGTVKVPLCVRSQTWLARSLLEVKGVLYVLTVFVQVKINNLFFLTESTSILCLQGKNCD